jgi:hypothetical protein
MYEDTIYIALPIPNGKYNILQLFLWMNLEKKSSFVQTENFLYMLLPTAVCELVTKPYKTFLRISHLHYCAQHRTTVYCCTQIW